MNSASSGQGSGDQSPDDVIRRLQQEVAWFAHGIVQAYHSLPADPAGARAALERLFREKQTDSADPLCMCELPSGAVVTLSRTDCMSRPVNGTCLFDIDGPGK